MKDDLWKKTTFDGRRPLTEDDLWRKTTLGRWPLTEDNLWWKTTFNGRRPLMKDDLRWKTTFDGRRPLTEEDLWRKMTFNGRRPLIGCIVYYLEKMFFDTSPWQPQHIWPQIRNPISCLNRKKNFTWWKKCTQYHACACVQKRRHF